MCKIDAFIGERKGENFMKREDDKDGVCDEMESERYCFVCPTNKQRELFSFGYEWEGRVR